MNSKRGGKREGAGRKPNNETKRILITARIDQTTHEKLMKLKGNRSLGLLIDEIIQNI